MLQQYISDSSPIVRLTFTLIHVLKFPLMLVFFFSIRLDSALSAGWSLIAKALRLDEAVNACYEWTMELVNEIRKAEDARSAQRNERRRNVHPEMSAPGSGHTANTPRTSSQNPRNRLPEFQATDTLKDLAGPTHADANPSKIPIVDSRSSPLSTDLGVSTSSFSAASLVEGGGAEPRPGPSGGRTKGRRPHSEK